MQHAQIVGEHVYLRGIEREDIDRGWLEWMNDLETTRYLARPLATTREDLETYYEASQWPDAAMFAVCERETDTYVGNARLSGFDWVSRSCGYGWLIGATEFRGRGYGTEALLLLLRFGFHHLGMHRIYSGVIEGNDASLAASDRLGMTREGVARQAHFVDGQYRDSVHIGMLRSEFDALHGGPGP